eukprot:7997253-Karenia_brevis.AAC.1
MGALQPAPLPGAAGRKEWDPPFVPAGPHGHLLLQTHQLGAMVDLRLGIIRAFNRIDIRYLEMPIQLLKPAIREFSFDMIHIASARTRTLLKDALAVDMLTYKRALLSDDQPEARHHNNSI